MRKDSVVFAVPSDEDLKVGERHHHEGVGGVPGELRQPLIDWEAGPLTDRKNCRTREYINWVISLL